MKNLLFYSFIFALLLSCNKKKQDNPQPTSQQKTIQQTPITPEPKYKKMTVGEEKCGLLYSEFTIHKNRKTIKTYTASRHTVLITNLFFGRKL